MAFKQGKGLMKIVQATLLAAAIAFTTNLSAQAPATAQAPVASSPSETSKPIATRGATWTRTRLAAAKKRWAENKIKFSACTQQLNERRKEKRMSLHLQAHYLQDCMTRKP